MRRDCAALRLSAGSAHESAERARAARAVSLCAMDVAESRMVASWLSASSSAWVSGDRAQARSWERVRPWRAAREGRGSSEERKSWRREGPGTGDRAPGGEEGERGMGSGQWGMGGEEGEGERLFESPASAGEGEGWVGCGVGLAGGVGSKGRRSARDWEKASRMGLVVTRVGLDRVSCLMHLSVRIGRWGARGVGWVCAKLRTGVVVWGGLRGLCARRWYGAPPGRLCHTGGVI